MESLDERFLPIFSFTISALCIPVNKPLIASRSQIYFALLSSRRSFIVLVLTLSCKKHLNFCIWNEVDHRDSFCPCGHPTGPPSFTEKAILSSLHCSIVCVINQEAAMCEPVYGVSPQFRGLSSTVPMPTNMLHIDLVAYVIQLCPFSYTA